jgi:hypothetical protein
VWHLSSRETGVASWQRGIGAVDECVTAAQPVA